MVSPSIVACDRDHQTIFATPVTNEALEEVMKDGIPHKTKANTSNGLHSNEEKENIPPSTDAVVSKSMAPNSQN